MADKKTAAELALAQFDPSTDALIVKKQAIPATTVKKALMLSQLAFDETTKL